MKPDNQKELFAGLEDKAGAGASLRLQASIYDPDFELDLVWLPARQDRPVMAALLRMAGEHSMEWSLRRGRKETSGFSPSSELEIRLRLKEWAQFYPVTQSNFTAVKVTWDDFGRAISKPCLLPPQQSPWDWMTGQMKRLVHEYQRSMDFHSGSPWLSRAQERREAELARLQQNKEVAARQKLERELKREARERRNFTENQPRPTPAIPVSSPAALPQVPVRFDFAHIEVQETALPVSALDGFKLLEKASLWWVSNQTDNLLCLPYCRIERLEYQIRTALRVLGPLRGRALLSDEVGLGKTIEAGLVLKELLTRGMVKRFLILTVPSLVDQWEEELNDKFGLAVATTNQGTVRTDPESFWRDNPAIVASLHTLKQPTHLEVARRTKWDMLVVDEAHYLRNRDSQSWQAVSTLPRQFLLLLTATPVQNSLEELYNLVTLLQPGQLPPPKEFRKRFIDSKTPRQPKEPEELRRLLSQVMIRNTRANAGLKLPPRRAETVLFNPGSEERELWQRWEEEFRNRLAMLNPSQASLWGRLLLQTAGSSPSAWHQALEKFPDKAAARSWQKMLPLSESWGHKCQLLVPLTKGEGGVVIFSQFLETQAGIEDYLCHSKVPVFVVNGATPAAERQPIIEQFRRNGGALLLTHSGTEGRNLQFCHQLVNFDLPWNPMEIEQRIGRLHRYGQKRPVRIYNFTQEGTLQQHLLEVLQEKLNLFELVIGETGLILGERFDSDEFAEEVLRRWRDNEGRVAEAMADFGEQLQSARAVYEEVKGLDESLFANDYASDL